MVRRRPVKPVANDHDDFTDFSIWVDEAIRHAKLTPADEGVTDAQQQWQSVSPQNRASLALALRAFWPAKLRFEDASKNLDALVTTITRPSRPSRKVTIRHEELKKSLQTRLDEATTVQGILDRLEERHENETFDDCLRDFLKHHVRQFKHDHDATAYWIGRSRTLQFTGTTGDADDRPDLELAAIIQEGYDAPDSEEDESESDDDNGTDKQPDQEAQQPEDQQDDQQAQQQGDQQGDQPTQQQVQQRSQQQLDQQSGQQPQQSTEHEDGEDAKGKGKPAPKPVSTSEGHEGDEQAAENLSKEKPNSLQDKSAEPGASRPMPSDAPVLHPQRKETSPFPPRPEVEQADAAINVPPLGTARCRCARSSRLRRFPSPTWIGPERIGPDKRGMAV